MKTAQDRPEIVPNPRKTAPSPPRLPKTAPGSPKSTLFRAQNRQAPKGAGGRGVAFRSGRFPSVGPCEMIYGSKCYSTKEGNEDRFLRNLKYLPKVKYRVGPTPLPPDPPATGRPAPSGKSEPPPVCVCVCARKNELKSIATSMLTCSHPKVASRRSKITPRGPKIAPRAPQEAPRPPQEVPSSPLERPQRPQDPPKRSQDRPKIAQEAPVERLPPPARVDVAHGSF